MTVKAVRSSAQPVLLGLEYPRPHRLFVVTRPLVDDVTAGYMLRTALWATRRGDEVTVVISGRALENRDLVPEALEPLLSSQARILIHEWQDAERAAPSVWDGCALTTDDGLAELLLTPQIQAQWC